MRPRSQQERGHCGKTLSMSFQLWNTPTLTERDDDDDECRVHWIGEERMGP